MTASKSSEVVTTGKGASVETTATKKPAKKQRGSLRLSKAESGRLLATFIGNTALMLPVTTGKHLNEVKPQLKKADNLTAFGHKVDSAATSAIDAWLVTSINTGTIDTAALCDSVATCMQTTSKCKGQPPVLQAWHTLQKVVSHLKAFESDTHFEKYLAKRMVNKGYTLVAAKSIRNSLTPVMVPVRADFQRAKLALQKSKRYIDAKRKFDAAKKAK